MRLAKEFLAHPEFEVIDLSANTIKAVKILVDESLVGHSLKQIAGNLKIVAYKNSSNEWQMFPDLETTLVNVGDNLILIGTSKDLKDFKP